MSYRTMLPSDLADRIDAAVAATRSPSWWPGAATCMPTPNWVTASSAPRPWWPSTCASLGS